MEVQAHFPLKVHGWSYIITLTLSLLLRGRRWGWHALIIIIIGSAQGLRDLLKLLFAFRRHGRAYFHTPV